jgi:predicted AAA+ superfamily ATPase
VSYQRHFKLLELLNKKSVLLLGPRQVGKSTLVQAHLPESAMMYNLAEADTYRELSAAPELVRQRLKDHITHLFIDEAQRLPELFDEVQSIIDRNPSLRVVLTGSSARKLRRSGINLLPGRIWRRDLFPLVFPETGPGRITDLIQRYLKMNFEITLAYTLMKRLEQRGLSEGSAISAASFRLQLYRMDSRYTSPKSQAIRE